MLLSVYQLSSSERKISPQSEEAGISKIQGLHKASIFFFYLSGSYLQKGSFDTMDIVFTTFSWTQVSLSSTNFSDFWKANREN